MIYRVGSWTADGGGFVPWQARTAAVYADGGTIGGNPSPIGGTWAWVAVDAGDWMIHWEHGWFEPPLSEHGGRELDAQGNATAGNNQSEMLATLMALRALKGYDAAWSGMIKTDSQLTIRRWTKSAGLAGIPYLWRHRMGELLRMPNSVGLADRWTLLDGHPTKQQIKDGVGKRGNPVSVHNVQCDALCARAAKSGAGLEVITLAPLTHAQ